MIGMKRKEKMIRIVSIILFVLLIGCSTMSTNNTKDESKPSINNVIDVLKNIPFPTL